MRWEGKDGRRSEVEGSRKEGERSGIEEEDETRGGTYQHNNSHCLLLPPPPNLPLPLLMINPPTHTYALGESLLMRTGMMSA